MRLLYSLVTLLLLTQNVLGDTYLMYPGGSNNRLDEANRGRNNNNRLFDSQNNNRGGRNVGAQYPNTAAKTNMVMNQIAPVLGSKHDFYEGSILPIQWTVQHGCGNPTSDCQVIIQYACDDLMRDGSTQATPPTNNAQCTAGVSCDEDYRYGRHESQEFYNKYCDGRSRNYGLYNADRQLNGVSARFTRQNNNGDRSGYECPEERDYYPYWHPTMWKDIAIYTTVTDRCPAYQTQSQNVAERYFCKVDDAVYDTIRTQNKYIPITELQCNTVGAWTKVDPFGIPAPDCLPHPLSRDNHHGDVKGRDYFGADKERDFATHWWKIPDHTIGQKCVLRIRYNITTGDQTFTSTTNYPYTANFGFNAKYSVAPSEMFDFRMNSDSPGNNANLKPSKFPVWERYGIDYSEVAQSFTGTIDATYRNSRGYVLVGQNNAQTPNPRRPQVDIFGSILGTTDRFFVQLAIDTSQYGRTFQDRTHVFGIRNRSPAIKSVMNSGAINLWNIGVRGKRGNVVQTYPHVEYDFVPQNLTINEGDLVHFQWTGSDTNPGNNAGNGKAGYDRSNIILLRKPVYAEQGTPSSDYYGQLGAMYVSTINDTSMSFLGLGYEDMRKLALFGLNSSQFDMGVRQATKSGVFNYVSTRNNDFSNRNQAAFITVKPRSGYPLYEVGTNQQRAYVDTNGANLEDGLGFATAANIEVEYWTQDGFDIYYVTPLFFAPMMSDDGPAAEGVNVNLNMKMNYDTVLNSRDIYWYANASAVENNQGGVWVSSASGEDTVVSTPITQGGVYVVKKDLRIAAVASIVIGVVIFVAIVSGLYYKIKIQPMGGFKQWWAYKKGASNYNNAAEMTTA